MGRSALRIWTKLILCAALWLPLAGCNTHDRAWETDADRESFVSGTAPGPPQPPPSREVVITVTANGATTCRQDGVFVAPLSSDEIVRNERPGKDIHLIIVQDNMHDRESCFPVSVDPDASDVNYQGSFTLRHLRQHLVIEVDRPSRVTLYTPDWQDDVDECAGFAADDDVDRVAARLNADPSIRDGRSSKLGRTALAQAANAGQADAVAFLLDRGAKTEVKDDQGYTPLHLAVRRGRLDIVRMLVLNKADVNALTVAGNTPMHLALSHNFTEIAAFLAGAGANSNLPNQAGRTPMQLALDKVFELSGRQPYGPFADGSSIRYADNRLCVLHDGQAEENNWEQFDLPSTRETWISLQGTNFMVLVRGRGTYHVWARYHPGALTPIQ